MTHQIHQQHAENDYTFYSNVIFLIYNNNNNKKSPEKMYNVCLKLPSMSHAAVFFLICAMYL